MEKAEEYWGFSPPSCLLFHFRMTRNDYFCLLYLEIMECYINPHAIKTLKRVCNGVECHGSVGSPITPVRQSGWSLL